MTSPYADLDRPPLSQREIDAALARGRPGQLWHEVRVVPATASTNADVVAAARAGAAEGLVVVAEHQNAGRGRLDRRWVSPPRAGLTFSMLFRPPVDQAARPLLPLLVAVATATAIAEQTDVEVRLKWPNDLVVAGRKLGGLLAEAVADAVVVGIGLNVSTTPEELPVDGATSLRSERGEAVDRQPLLLAILRAVDSSYAAWTADAGSPVRLLDDYRALSATLGRAVAVELPAGERLTGTACDIDDGGRLVVETAAGRRSVSAGDVVHAKPGD